MQEDHIYVRGLFRKNLIFKKSTHAPPERPEVVRMAPFPSLAVVAGSSFFNIGTAEATATRHAKMN